MKTKIVYQWKEKDGIDSLFRSRSGFFCVIWYCKRFNIYMLFMTLLPDSVENDPDKLFFLPILF